MGVLDLVEQIDAREGSGRIGGHRHQHPLQPGDQGADGAGIEDVGAELHVPTDPGGTAVGVPGHSSKDNVRSIRAVWVSVDNGLTRTPPRLRSVGPPVCPVRFCQASIT